ELPSLPAPLPVPKPDAPRPGPPAAAPRPATTAAGPGGDTNPPPAGFSALPNPGAGLLPEAAVPAAIAPTPSSPTLNLVGDTEDPAVARLRTGYRIVLLLAAAGAATHLVRQRTRLT
ncbi:MAG TPA: hypothetical protein VGL92_00370, partial [Acidimicrobiia bacterium]